MATSLNISLPERLKAYVDARVEAGQYRTPSEYVSDLIQHDQARQQSDGDQTVAALEQRLLDAIQNEQGFLELTADEVRSGGVVTRIRRHLAASR